MLALTVSMKMTIDTSIIAALTGAGLDVSSGSQVKVVDTEYGPNHYYGALKFATLDGSINATVVGSSPPQSHQHPCEIGCRKK